MSALDVVALLLISWLSNYCCRGGMLCSVQLRWVVVAVGFNGDHCGHCPISIPASAPFVLMAYHAL